MSPRSEETKLKIGEAVRAFWVGKERPSWNKGKVGIYSPEYRAKISQNHRTYQSLETRRKISESHIKKNAHLVSPLFKKTVRGIAKYREWVHAVYRRDCFACQVCGYVGKPSRVCEKGIQADHYPLSFIELIIKYNIKTTAEAIACEEL